MSKAEELINEDGKYFAASGRIKYYPLAIDHGYGATLVDVDGKEYIDLLSSASSQNVGHAPKPVTEAIKKQAEKFIHYTPAYMYHEPAVKLSKKLCKIAPGDYEKRVTFGLSGSLMRMMVLLNLRELIRDALTLLVLQMHIMGQHLGHYPCLPLV